MVASWGCSAFPTLNFKWLLVFSWRDLCQRGYVFLHLYWAISFFLFYLRFLVLIVASLFVSVFFTFNLMSSLYSKLVLFGIIWLKQEPNNFIKWRFLWVLYQLSMESIQLKSFPNCPYPYKWWNKAFWLLHTGFMCWFSLWFFFFSFLTWLCFIAFVISECWITLGMKRL